MNNFNKAFEAGRNAVRNRRTVLLLMVFAFMAVGAAIDECLEHHYVSAVLAIAFFLVVMPWLGWAWIKRKA